VRELTRSGGGQTGLIEGRLAGAVRCQAERHSEAHAIGNLRFSVKGIFKEMRQRRTCEKPSEKHRGKTQRLSAGPAAGLQAGAARRGASSSQAQSARRSSAIRRPCRCPSSWRAELPLRQLDQPEFKDADAVALHRDLAVAHGAIAWRLSWPLPRRFGQ
jgi:hypothetical protein